MDGLSNAATVFKNFNYMVVLSVSRAAGVQIAEYKALNSKEDEAQYETKIEEGKRNLNDFETQLKLLRREKDMLASEAADLAGLRLKQEELADKEQTLQKLYIRYLIFLQ